VQQISEFKKQLGVRIVMRSLSEPSGERLFFEGCPKPDIGLARDEADRRNQSDIGQTLGLAIRSYAHRQPNQSAIVSSTFAPLSYRQLQEQIDGIRAKLRLAGLGHQARIGIALPDGPEAVLAIVAVACSAIAVPIDPKLTSSEVELRLGILRLDAIILLRNGDSSPRRVAEHHGLRIVEAIPIGGRKLGLQLDMSAAAPSLPPDEPGPEAIAFILQTSGTTALPKLVPVSHRNMLASSERWRAWFKLTPLDRCLCVSAPYYCHGLTVTVLTPLLTGGSVALPTNAAAMDFVEWFEILSPTWFSAVPTLHRLVLDAARTTPDASGMHALRLASSGGAPLPAPVRDGLQNVLGIPILEHYGASEAAQVAVNLPVPNLNKPGTCGKPWPGTVVIVSQEGHPLPPGQQGEVLVGGPTVISGYLDDPELNRAAFVNGWFRTGDIGSLDREGFLTLHGRIKEQINRGGEKISPVEVDTALLRHPAVAEAAAFAVPHPRLGEDVAAAVVLRPDATATSVELRRFLADHVASFKIPRRITILDQLPKGATGKILRRKLSASLSGPASEDLAQKAARAPEVDLADLERKLLSLWRHMLESESIGLDDDFFEAGGDSLLATQMILELELMLGHPVHHSILFEASTIRKLVGSLGPQAAFDAGPIMRLHATGSRRPLLYFHGALGFAHYLRELSLHLGADQPILAIEPHGLQGQVLPSSIEEMAADRVKLILEMQPEGPYRLGGFCNGALVALEAARLLTVAGQNVELLLLIDPPSVHARPLQQTILSVVRPLSDRAATWTWRWMARIEKLSILSWTQQWAFLKSELLARIRVRKPARSLRAGVPLDPSLPASSPSDIIGKYQAVMSRYRAEPLAVPATIYSAGYDGRGWSGPLADLEIVRIPGGHLECVTDHVGDLGNHLRAKLQMRTSRGTHAA
jgi:acyl-CoA synthetase (AMP-forming)/AMP-acid ligase II/thioesterase domain-containing protein